MPITVSAARVPRTESLPAVVLAAGNGSRLVSSPLTPKPLLQLGRRPLLGHVIDCLQAAGTPSVHVVVGYGAHAICEHPGLVPPGMDVRWVHNPRFDEPNGLSLLCARHSIPGRFLLLMADHLLDVRTIGRLLACRATSGRSALAIDRKLTHVCDLDDATLVREVQGQVEAIGKRLHDANAVDTGLFLLTPSVFEAMDESVRRGDRTLTGGISVMAERGEIDAWDVGAARWVDVDTPAAAAHALDLLAQGLVGSEAVVPASERA
jgi:1L-myo-inositol 1-phosphate cytidylyltransferase